MVCWLGNGEGGNSEKELGRGKYETYTYGEVWGYL